MFKLKTLVLDIANFANNLVTLAKIQQIGAYKTLANITGSTANISEVNIGYTPNGAVTLSGNVTYEKSDFAGRTHLLLSTNSSATRTFTVSNTGFTAGDLICLLINQNSSGDVSVTIGTRALTGNRGNIINGLFDGTNWHVWGGGGVFNTTSANFNSFANGLSAKVTSGGNNQTALGNFAQATGASSTAIGYNNQTSGTNGIGIGDSTLNSGSNSTGVGTAISINANNVNVVGSQGTGNANEAHIFSRGGSPNSFVRSNGFGAFVYNRRYGATRIHLLTTTSLSDTTNPSLNKEWATWNGTTANDTITEIFLRGVSSNRCVLQAKNVLSFRGQAVAFRNNYTGSARWSIEGLIKRNNGNNTTLVGVTATLTHSDGTGDTLVLTITADDTNEALKVEVTGNASETWTWGVELELLDLRIA